MNVDRRYAASALTCAVTGGDVLPSQSPAIPCGVEAIVRESVAAARAGAAIVHVHAREPDGRPTSSGETFREIVTAIRRQSDVVVCVSTGGAPGMSATERIAGVQAVGPELATLNLGTMNYEVFPSESRRPVVTSQWEQDLLGRAGQNVFMNTLGMVREFAQEFRHLGVTPELEVYDLSQLGVARLLLEEGVLEAPLRVQFVLGVIGGATSEIEVLLAMREASTRILGDAVGSLGVAAAGYPMQLRHAAVALGLGMDCRVGLEDSLRISRDRQAESNAELVGAAVDLARIVGRPLATPSAVREGLGPWSRRK
ncbi:MAG: beta-keto acid cleavage family enzyme [Candidatus Dormibacteria bacterium]